MAESIAPTDPWALLARTVQANWPKAPLERLEGAMAICSEWPEAPRTRALERARALTELRLEPDAIAAGLVCSGPELDPKILASLGPEVVPVVEGVRRLSGIEWDALDRESAESLRRMFVAMAADIRVVLIVLADRLLELRGLAAIEDVAVRRKIARETMEVFAPLANRLGVGQFKWELEDLALRELEPAIYREISSELAQTRADRRAFVGEVISAVEAALSEEGLAESIVKRSGRAKHIASIYAKMLRKGVPLSEIHDQIAVRIIVKTVADCYAVLGVVHGLWTPIAGEFDDYIARPKKNLYQSLHTAVVGPHGRSVEVQIRTQEMHEYAEFGVAAHWAYKEGKAVRGSSRIAPRSFDVLRQLLEWHEDLSESDGYAEAIKTDLFADEVHVFTPKGEVIALPRGSTSLDFAYRIHTLVGHRCRGAKIDGQIVTLDTPLRTGQRIEVLLRKEPSPSRDWLSPHLGYLRTASARHKVRQFFRKQDREQSVAQGREQLERELMRLGLGDVGDALSEIAGRHRLAGAEELWAAIGFGDLGATTIAAAIFDLLRPRAEPKQPPTSFDHGKPRQAAGVSVDGVDHVLSRPARCCAPVPGDDVVGFVTRGRGVAVHRRDCTNIVHAQEPERIIDVDWGQDTQKRYPVTIAVDVADARGVFRDVMSIVAALGFDVREANTSGPRRDHSQTITFTTEVVKSEDLVRLLARLSALPSVIAARRTSE